jgi:hypothetical protein
VYTKEKQRTERDPRVVYTIPGPQKRRKKSKKDEESDTIDHAGRVLRNFGEE